MVRFNNYSDVVSFAFQFGYGALEYIIENKTMPEEQITMINGAINSSRVNVIDVADNISVRFGREKINGTWMRLPKHELTVIVNGEPMTYLDSITKKVLDGQQWKRIFEIIKHKNEALTAFDR